MPADYQNARQHDAHLDDQSHHGTLIPTARRFATISLKSLALWRVALGLSCLQVVLRRWALLDVFYTETGAHPRGALGGLTWEAGPLYWLSASPRGLHLAFALCFALTAAFTLGAFTRYAKWLLLPALIAVDSRNPILVTGGECVLHAQALFVAFLPVGAVWSVDAWQRARRTREPRTDEPTAVTTPMYPLLLVQLAVIYFFCMYAKFGPSWLDGTAVAQALGSATLVTEFGGWVLHWPTPLLHALTHGTRLVEGLLPLLILSPWYRRYTHAAAAALMLALHGGILLAMEVGSFSVAMLSFLPLLWHPREEQRLLPKTAKAQRFEVTVVALLGYFVVARLSHDLILWPARPQLPLPRWVLKVSADAGLLQPWMMFGPEPPERDFIIVTDAVTRKGLHFDPWRAVAGGSLEPLKVLPQSVVKKHVFTRYEGDLTFSHSTYLHPFFSRWVLAQRGPDGEPVERYDAWLMIVSTLPGEVVPARGFERRAHVLALPFKDALPVQSYQAQGVWAPERATDRKIGREGSNVLNPISASMSAGCPSLTLDLGEPHALRSAYLQADAADDFRLEGSLDGHAFHDLAEMPPLYAGQLRSRIIELPGESVRFVRIRPMKSRGMSHTLSEIALFDHTVKLPKLPRDTQYKFISALDRPSVAGILSGSNHPSPECPAENLATQFATAPKPR